MYFSYGLGLLDYSQKKEYRADVNIPTEILNEAINLKNCVIESSEEDMKEIMQSINLIHQQYDSLLTRCKQYIQQIKKGETINMEDLSTTHLFTFTKQIQKRSIDLEIKRNVYNIRNYTHHMKILER